MKFAIAIGIAVVVALVWSWRSRRPIGTRRRVSLQQAGEAFACVTIEIQESACAAVRALVGTRFLRRLAPILPLSDCDCLACTCRYQHHPDRRYHDRREPYRPLYPETIGDRRINRADRRRNVLSA